MSAAPTEPTPSPVPIRSLPDRKEEDMESDDVAADNVDDVENTLRQIRKEIAHLQLKSSALERIRPHPNPGFPAPKLRLKVQDLNHHGAQVFFANVNPIKALSEAVDAVLSILYEPTRTNKHVPSTRSVTLILRSMDGVAYTAGSELDDDHKRICFSLDYISGIFERNPDSGQPGAEIRGVLVHEMVHCWQWNGLGSAPGGLIEGIADFVRLKACLSPAHWKREAGEKWDAGYQTTGYFLEWIENRFGQGSVRKINQALQDTKYEQVKFWSSLFGMRVKDLWKDYSKSLEEEGGGTVSGAQEAPLDPFAAKGSKGNNQDHNPMDKGA